MRATELFEDSQDYDLQAKYDKFNIAYFGGELPTIPLIWANLKSVGGKVTAKIVRVGPTDPYKARRDKYYNAEIKPGTMALTISNRFKRDEEGLDGILLHEMIHVYFFHNKMYSENHGSRFLAMCRKISVLSGVKVPLKDDSNGLDLAQEALKAYGVILIYSGTGQPSFALVSAKNAHSLSEQIKKSWVPRIRRDYPKAALYTIATPLWTKIGATVPVNRNVMSPKFYKLHDPQAALKDLLANGHRLWELSL